MNHYEAVFILDPRLDEEQLAAMRADLKSRIEGAAARDIVEVKFERRPLTYSIRKQTEAFYLIYGFDGPTDIVGKLRLELKHTEQILRMSYLRAAPPPPSPAAAPAPKPAAEPVAQVEPAAMPEPPSPESPEPVKPERSVAQPQLPEAGPA